MDQRLLKLSHSSRLTLHECPRKFQLYRLGTDREADTEDESGTFGFGHLIGTAIQEIFQNKSYQQVVLNAFLNWNQDLFYVDDRRKKSFFYGMLAIKKFFALRQAGFLKDYELVEHNGKAACELGFSIHLPDGFAYRGFVDIVLRHKISGAVLVVEVKTTAMKVVAEAFKNSGQAIGYSVVLDHLFPGLSSYKVLYLVYKTTEQEFDAPEYPKTLYQRALWLNELLLDCANIKQYVEHNVFPMHGENCVNKYNKLCKYFGVCTLRTDTLIKPESQAPEEKVYDFVIQFEDLVNTQLGQAPAFSGHIDTEEDEVL